MCITLSKKFLVRLYFIQTRGNSYAERIQRRHRGQHRLLAGKCANAKPAKRRQNLLYLILILWFTLAGLHCNPLLNFDVAVFAVYYILHLLNVVCASSAIVCIL